MVIDLIETYIFGCFNFVSSEKIMQTAQYETEGLEQEMPSSTLQVSQTEKEIDNASRALMKKCLLEYMCQILF